ncbi:MAG: T9SS type A sorting domain-containing protein [Xanthomarina gelatinilytica]|uniref:T9SS type A sorting domain-containing protein n=1 Tax=Xanthomarina gelatinilytica TaxID=1137281 RepID=UPI003A87596E
MKKTVLILTLIIFSLYELHSQVVNIPDVNFKSYLLGEPSINTNADAEIQVTEAEAFTGYLACNNLGIADLTGIEAFINLTELYINDNNLSSIDLSGNTNLHTLFCSRNTLTQLDVSNNTALISLQCDDNQLTALDVSNNTSLMALICYLNNISTLDVSNNVALQNLSVRENQLTTLDVSNNTSLVSLVCSVNNLTTIDVSNNTALVLLECGETGLSTLDVSNNTNLSHLDCRGNNLTTLDLSNNIALDRLDCYFNGLTELDLSANSNLTILWCSNNDLTSLNVANGNNTSVTYFNTTLNPSLTCIQVDDATYSSANWTNIDATTSFNEDCSSMSVSDFDLNTISIYPNPANNSIYVKHNGEIINYSINTITGQLIKKGTLDATIHLKQLPNGVYLLSLYTTNGHKIIKKIIKD